MSFDRFLFLLAVALMTINALTSCGTASGGGSVTVDAVPGPGGRTCYALMQDGRLGGGNCP